MDFSLLAPIQVPIVVIDKSFNVFFKNQCFEKMMVTEISRDNALLKIVNIEKKGCKLKELMARLMKSLDFNQTTEINQCSIDGRAYNANILVTKIINEDVSLLLLQINEQKSHPSRLVSFFDISPVAIMITDVNDIIISVNASFEEMIGYKQSELLGMRPDFLRSGLHEDDTLQKMWLGLKHDRHWKGEVHHRRKDNSIITSMLSITCNDNFLVRGGYVSFLSDISSHFREISKLKEHAYHDYLTKLPNRYLLERDINVLISNRERFNLCFIDLGSFKYINDTMGHETGDKVLIEVGKRLSSLRSLKAFRYGGDEFIAIGKQVGMTEVIRNALSECHKINETAIKIETHIGISSYPEDGEDIDNLISMADKRMYVEKKS
ncbi:MAG: hypothetical protein DI541_12135 [Aeromonas media]|nr:MAG: hypothetical protein DI541_12135 [Aeromonas media]